MKNRITTYDADYLLRKHKNANKTIAALDAAGTDTTQAKWLKAFTEDFLDTCITQRESEVYTALYIDRYNIKLAAAKLGISRRTVAHHRLRILSRFVDVYNLEMEMEMLDNGN